ncbi:hypothetical protein G9X64_31605 [Rhizobium sophorae]|uniref:Uncharacterized protein n=1 Tax=Rhizobium sophorae TaxID=1535242 RepID=A0A7Y3WI76_9HYPH|nr:hypothetical protein [Rhizobium sophorae]MBX4865061.1 hypothetical protein [Rhizobium bangladeshense]NNU40949.1 hypothetical protein [Rhizobium sophorae]
MTGITDRSIDFRNSFETRSGTSKVEHADVWNVGAVFSLLFLIRDLSQNDRILLFILTEKIRTDRGPYETRLGLLPNLVFGASHLLVLLPLAGAAYRELGRLILASCIFLWSFMTALAGLTASCLFLTLTRFGIARSAAGNVPLAILIGGTKPASNHPADNSDPFLVQR